MNNVGNNKIITKFKMGLSYKIITKCAPRLKHMHAFTLANVAHTRTYIEYTNKQVI